MADDLQTLKFMCSGCGECCKRIGKLTKEQRIKLDFPYEPKVDGSCEKLGEDGKCTIYETRPLICNVERTYEKYHAPKGRSKKEVFMAENKICNELIKQNRLDEKYLIDLSGYLDYI